MLRYRYTFYQTVPTTILQPRKTMDKERFLAGIYVLANQASESNDPRVRLGASALLSLRAAFCNNNVDFETLTRVLPKNLDAHVETWRKVQAGLPVSALTT